MANSKSAASSIKSSVMMGFARLKFATRFSRVPRRLVLGCVLLLILGCSTTIGADAIESKNVGKTFSKKYVGMFNVRKALLEEHDHGMYPPTDNDEPVQVSLHMHVRHFEVDESSHMFTVHGYLTQEWQDQRLTWNDTSVSTVYLDESEIWTPDLTVYNEAYPPDSEPFGSAKIRVNRQGYVWWSPPFKLSGHCSLNMVKWPHDSHICYLQFFSRSYDAMVLDLVLHEQEMDIGELMVNHEWVLKDYAVKRNQSADELDEASVHVEVSYVFEIERRSSSYTAAFIIPAYVITFVNLMIFLLPPASSEKLTLAGFNLLVISQYLLWFEARLPAMGDHVPLLVLQFVVSFILLGLTIFISVIVIYLCRTRRASSPPYFIRMICNAHFARALGLGHLVPYVSQTHNRIPEGVEMRHHNSNGGIAHTDLDKDDQTQRLTDYSSGGGVSYHRCDAPYMWNADWILLASMIDRISFITFTVVSGIFLGLMT